MEVATTYGAIELKCANFFVCRSMVVLPLSLIIGLGYVGLTGCSKDAEQTTVVDNNQQAAMMSGAPADVAPAIVADDLNSAEILHMDPGTALDSLDDDDVSIDRTVDFLIEDEVELPINTIKDSSLDNIMINQ